MNLRDALEKFLSAARAERNLAERTVTDYGKYLASLVAFAERNGVRDVEQLDVQVLRAWLRELLDVDHRGKSAVAIALYAARTWTRWMHKRRMVKVAAGEELATPKQRRSMPRALSEEQAAKLMDAPDPTTPVGIRDRAVVELLYAGLRVSEVCGLDRVDVELQDEPSVRVRHGKGDKDRLVPIGRHAVARLRRWLLLRPSADGDALFVTLQVRRQVGERDRKGRCLRPSFVPAPSPQRIGKRAVELLVTDYGAKVGIERAAPHQLRHACATHMLRRGADLRAIQVLLGHSSLNTTQRYLGVEVSDLLRVHRDAHPLGQAKPRDPRRAEKVLQALRDEGYTDPEIRDFVADEIERRTRRARGPGLAKARLRHVDAESL